VVVRAVGAGAEHERGGGERTDQSKTATPAARCGGGHENSCCGGAYGLRSAMRCWRSTAITMITPFATFWVDVERLLSVKTLVRVVKIRTPKIVPTTVPRPPISSVPPMTTAAIASSSRSVPCVDDPVVVRDISMTAAMPQVA